jgi:hypothetical protein
MAVTFPKWSAHEVADWEGLLIREEGGEWSVNLATAAVINYMPIIGITELTSENAVDAYWRISLVQFIFGSYIEVKDGSGQGRPLFLTIDDIVRHVGLKTEGVTKTHTEFYNSVCRGVSAARIDSALSAAYVANGNRALLEVVLGGSNNNQESVRND